MKFFSNKKIFRDTALNLSYIISTQVELVNIELCYYNLISGCKDYDWKMFYFVFKIFIYI